jgi:large exoprotein involved in heme utilization and adhesion
LSIQGEQGGGNVTVNARNLSLKAGELGSTIIGTGIRSESTSVEAQAGDVTIDVAENITLDGSSILNQVDSGGVGNSGNITINTGSLEAINGGKVDASTFGQGNAGAVKITATGDITADGENSEGFSSGVISQVGLDAVGNAGGVTISTNNLTLTNGGEVDASTSGKGDAGAINITATGDLAFDGEDSEGIPSGATSLVDTDAVGNAGGVTISTTNLNLTKGGRVDASTFGQGDAGAVKITATSDITIDGEDSEGIPSGATSRVEPDAEGSSGGVTISTTNLNLTKGGRVDAATFGQGDAGAVKITATGDLTFDGETSGGTPSRVGSEVIFGARGNSGEVTIKTSNLTLTNGGRVSAFTADQGNAGSVDITATGDLAFDGETSKGFPSGVINGVEADAEGNAEGVTISTNNLTLTNGGVVNVSTFGQGNAGAVTINATGDITADGETSEGFASGIASNVETNAVGNAGGIRINSGNITLTKGAFIGANTSGQGNAGSVNITATGDITFDGEDSQGISSGVESIVTSDAQGNAGVIDIQANNLDLVNTARINAATQSPTGESGKIDLRIAEDITLQGNSFISAQAFKDADGGNLNIDARFVVAFPSNGVGNDLVATAEQGIGGNINLNAEQIFGLERGQAINDETGDYIRNNNNDLDVSSNVFGFDGSVNINISDVNPVQGTTELPSNVVEATQTADQNCSADSEGKATNGLAIAGRGGVTPPPDAPLNSENISNENSAQASIPEPIETAQGKIQPARGIKFTKDGRIILTAYPTNNAGERIPEVKNNCGQI